MEIYHEKEASSSDRITIPDWNASHKITGLYGYGLIEEIVLGVGSTEMVFDNLTSEMWDKYLLEFGLIGSGATTLGINFNGDTNTAHYGNYAQLQESDGNSHHLTNWGYNGLCGRIYPAVPYISTGCIEITFVGSGMATWKSEWVMLNAGWGENGGTWYYPNAGYINSITLKRLEATTISGYGRLYKLMNLGVD